MVSLHRRRASSDSCAACEAATRRRWSRGRRSSEVRREGRIASWPLNPPTSSTDGGRLDDLSSKGFSSFLFLYATDDVCKLETSDTVWRATLYILSMQQGSLLGGSQWCAVVGKGGGTTGVYYSRCFPALLPFFFLFEVFFQPVALKMWNKKKMMNRQIFPRCWRHDLWPHLHTASNMVIINIHNHLVPVDSSQISHSTPLRPDSVRGAAGWLYETSGLTVVRSNPPEISIICFFYSWIRVSGKAKQFKGN